MTSTARRIFYVVNLFAALGTVGASAWAGPFNRLVVFGDSLSDVGNVADASLNIVPGSYYYNDRFSNGPVWVDALSASLGLGGVQPSRKGGDNFAYGGAQTTGSGGIGGLFIRDVDQQVSQYLSSRTVDPDGLFVIFAGANDLFGGATNVDAVAGNLARETERLVNAGARHFLIPNTPLLGYTPRYNGSLALFTENNALSNRFNATLEARLDALAASRRDLTIYRLDVAGLMEQGVANPAKFGLKNTGEPAAPGLEPGDLLYDRRRIAARPNEYLFWDEIHPTTVVHAALGQAAFQLIEGVLADFNTDGVVDDKDLALWQQGFAQHGMAVLREGDANHDGQVDGLDLLAWQRSVGSNLALSAGRSNIQVVPEPTASALVVALAMARCAVGCKTSRRIALATRDYGSFSSGIGRP